MFLVLALWMIGAAGVTSDLDIPPWAPSREETKLPDDATLPACERAVQEVISPTGAKLISRQYSKSSKWGTILRAEATASPEDTSSEFTVMCWGSDTGIHMWMDFSKPGKDER